MFGKWNIVLFVLSPNILHLGACAVHYNVQHTLVARLSTYRIKCARLLLWEAFIESMLWWIVSKVIKFLNAKWVATLWKGILNNVKNIPHFNRISNPFSILCMSACITSLFTTTQTTLNTAESFHMKPRTNCLYHTFEPQPGLLELWVYNL